jgi:hypothetical protein
MRARFVEMLVLSSPSIYLEIRYSFESMYVLYISK